MSQFLRLGTNFTQWQWQKTKKWRYVFMLFSLLVQVCALTPIAASVEEIPSTEITQFLDILASTDVEHWPQVVDELKSHFSGLLTDLSLEDFLNCLKVKILESNDLELIKLYNRAVRNHDTLSTEKTEPVPCYYKHYQSPDFFVSDIHLTFDVSASYLSVISDLTIWRNSKKKVLILDGKEHKVHHILMNGEVVSKEHYQVTPHELILFNIPLEESFNVKIYSEINPFKNESLEGMYQCGQWLTTQCESEGARRIFFTLDRPDVLSRITTTIIADKERYPYRLSNGNFVSEHIQEDGRAVITWHDPFPKPSYLFACVLGNFSQLTTHFKTKSGKEIELQIYVEAGKEARAHYAFFALKKAMEFDEVFFDREYDLSCLKMVGIPDFNSGAMENKGLMIFNDVRLLVDSLSGTDKSYREVAHVVAHEYFHNWSGNRVTVRNWFEIALKEAFTDLRAMLFNEWLFGAEFIRPKAVQLLKESQFPEEISERGHPLIVESYVDAHSIYDSTTYIKGREVFRTFKNYIDMLVPDGFREVQNLYFSRYDGQAVTFRELLAAGNEILKKAGKDLCKFERWFHQPGTPTVQAHIDYDSNKKEVCLIFTQACPHPQTGEKQEPFQIPFSVELLGKEGVILCPKISYILEEESTIFHLPCIEKPTPVFMHGYSAPINFHYEYTKKDLACIIKYTDDAFCRWEATQNYSILAFKEMKARLEEDPTLETKAQKGEVLFPDLYQLYHDVLKTPQLSPLAKAQLLELPSIRALSQKLNDYDFARLGELRSLFIQQLAHFCKPLLEKILEDYVAPAIYQPESDQMQIRELRHTALGLLALVDEKYKKDVLANYQSATSFEDTVSAFNLCLQIGHSYKDFVIENFYHQWKEDKAVFNFWLSSQAFSSTCTVTDLRKLEAVKGYEAKNPNHVRSIFRTFIANLRCYHSPTGEGYEYIVDKILEIAHFNPFLAHNYLAVPAFLDFENLPEKQKALMAKALERLRGNHVPAQTRDLVEKILKRYEI